MEFLRFLPPCPYLVDPRSSPQPPVFMESIRIFVEEGAVLPSREEGSSGYDLVATKITMDCSEYIEYGTGIHVEIPEGYEGQLRARSSVSKYNLVLANGVGTIDSSYRGEIRARFKKIIPVAPSGDIPGNTVNDVEIDEEGQFIATIYVPGDKVAQLVIAPVALPKLLSVWSLDDLTRTERGSGGFGSTGA